MLRYVLKRIALLIPVLICVSLLVFVLQGIAPGEPVDFVLGTDITDAERTAWNEKYDLDKPLIVQYGKYMYELITKGEFGISYRTGKSVTTEVVSRWPKTFLLTLAGMAIYVTFGITFGVISATHRGKLFDNLTRIFSMVFISMPNFWLALMLILVFSVRLKIFPVSGFYGVKYAVLPAITIGVWGMASMMRTTRSAMLDNLDQDFVRTARAKGQTNFKVVMNHVLKNALIPIITATGTLFANGMAGGMILEQIFAIPGLGTLMVTSINNRDYPQLRACILLTAATVSIINLVIDICYAAVDPRIKDGFKSKSAKKVRKGKEAVSSEN